MEAITGWCHVAPGGRECKPAGVVSLDEASAAWVEVPRAASSRYANVKTDISTDQLLFFFLTLRAVLGKICAVLVKTSLNPRFVA